MYHIPKRKRHSEIGSKKKFHSTKCLKKEIGETLYYQLNSIPERSGKTTKNKHTQEEQIAGNTPNGAKIIKIETKRRIQKVN